MDKEKKSPRIFARAAGIMLFVLTIGSVVSVALSAVFLPTLKISDSSLAEYRKGDVTLCLKAREYKRGDIVAFQVGDEILVRRIAALSGQWVDMDGDGNVYVNNKTLAEPHLTNIGQGAVTVNLPCQVPENCVFVLSDDLSFDKDSRSAEIGCINLEQITGKVMFRLWTSK